MDRLCSSTRVRFRDLDALEQVNYASYLTFLEEALNELWKEVLRRVGREFVPTARGCVTARAEIDCRGEALCGEILDVHTWLSRVGRSSFTTSYRVEERVTGKTVVEAKTVQVVTWREAERAAMPGDIRAALVEMMTDGRASNA